MSKKSMTKAAAARIQSATAKTNGGEVPKGSFAARAQSAASQPGKTTPPKVTKKTPLSNGPSKTGKPSGKGRDNHPPKNK
ncbi:hypothetical protein AAEU28_12095 [Pseudoalteromonas sp. SS15]|uniref:hypothetical protein n=1 Tax=Pseudoalteromonas sp. SS15 TaxID=3139393 RepID=UPI003BA9259D